MTRKMVVNVRFSEEEVNLFKEVAEREDRSLSSLIRLLSLKNLEIKKENVIDMGYNISIIIEHLQEMRKVEVSDMTMNVVRKLQDELELLGYNTKFEDEYLKVVE